MERLRNGKQRRRVASQGEPTELQAGVVEARNGGLEPGRSHPRAEPEGAARWIRGQLRPVSGRATKETGH